MNVEGILANLSRHVSLSEEEKNFFISLLKEQPLSRKQFLLEAGKPCTTFNYVNKGALRAFYRTKEDKEVTIMFAIVDWWITDMPCFINGQPAMIAIEAIDDTNVLQLTKESLDLLYDSVPKFERYMRTLMQNAYIREQLRVLQNLSMTAEERYTNFLKKYPGIAKQVTNKHIASYLGITPEFLSVVRNKISKNDIS